MPTASSLLILLASSGLLFNYAAANSPLICEQPIDNQPPFNGDTALCLLGCGQPRARANASALPGSVNTTEIPYCELDCVRGDATPAQSSAAPGCSTQCRARDSATPEQLGWCMYWCVEGGSVEQLVLSTTCVPSLERVPETTTLTSGSASSVETYLGFTVPPAWVSWYKTQTVISRTQTLIFASTPTSSSSTTRHSNIGMHSTAATTVTTPSMMITTAGPTTTTTSHHRTMLSGPSSISSSSTASSDGGVSDKRPGSWINAIFQLLTLMIPFIEI